MCEGKGKELHPGVHQHVVAHDLKRTNLFLRSHTYVAPPYSNYRGPRRPVRAEERVPNQRTPTAVPVRPRIRARHTLLEPQLEHAAHGRFDGRGGREPSWPVGDRSGPPTAQRCAVGVRYPWRHSWRLSAPYRHTVGAGAYTNDFHPFAVLRSTRCVSTDSARCAVGTWSIRASAQGRSPLRGL